MKDIKQKGMKVLSLCDGWTIDVIAHILSYMKI